MIALYLNINGNHRFIVNKLFPIYEDLGVDILWYSDEEEIHLMRKSSEINDKVML